MILFGAHVSASGGHHLAVARAAALGANCLQLFAGSPRVWKRPDLSTIDAQKITSEMKDFTVEKIFTHSLYLVNLASDKPDLIEKSKNALVFDLEFDAHIGGSGIVVHLGSHQGRGWEASRQQVRDAIVDILERTPKNSTFLIENSAGQNGKLCSDLSEIRWLLDELDSPRVGWCVDTCHGFAAGYAIGSAADDSSATGELFAEQKRTLHAEISHYNLWDDLACIHVNDSRDPFASGRDRHANLGEGAIPQEDFVWFLHQPELQTIPLILEVPGEGSGPDKVNLDRLKEWAQ